MSRILVTGASGFVGRALVTALSGWGYDVRAAVRRRPQPPFADGLEVVTHPDLAISFDWSPLLADVEAVVHLAGIAHTAGIPEADYERINHHATAALAAAAARTDVKRFVFVSSIRAQSGPTAQTTLTEDDDPRPTDAYGRSKLAAETIIKSAGVPFTILRPVLVYGAGVKGNLAALMRFADLPCPLPFGALRNPRSLVARDDLISAIRFALEGPATIGETFIVAHPRPSSPAEMIAGLRAARGRKPWLIPVPPVALAAALALVRRRDLWDRLAGRLVASPDKLMKAGWRPQIDTVTGLAQITGMDERQRDPAQKKG